MKLFCYADSSQHHIAEKYLLATLRRFNEFDVVYETNDKPDTIVLQAKAERILAFINRTSAAGETSFVWADNDIVVLKPFRSQIESAIGGCDVAFQSAMGYLCAGLFIAKLNERFIKYWTAVANYTGCYTGGGTGDQMAADFLRKMVNGCLLPEEEFWTPCADAPSTLSNPAILNQYVPNVPASALLVHMCCVQYPYKIKALDHCLTL